jgi:glycosyltransferase involved in cell wall biosynthesis
VAGVLGNLGDGWQVEHFTQSIQRADLPWPPRARRAGEHWVEHRMRDPISAAWLIGLSKIGGFGAAYADRLLAIAPRRKIRDLLARADVVMVSPHYQFPWVRKHTPSNTPIVVDCHMIEHHIWRPGKSPWSKALAHEIEHGERNAFSSADLIFATSDDDARHVMDMGGRRIVIVANGADLDRFRPASSEERLALRRRLGLPEETVIAVFVGAAGPDNRDAVALLERQAAAFVERGVQPLVVGRVGMVRPHVPNVIYTGEVDDVSVWLRAADIGLCNLLGGSGTSLKSVEYLGAGLAVLGTPVGVRGLGVTPGVEAIVDDADAMPARARELAADESLRARLGAAARRLAEERFSWRAIGAIAARELDVLAAAR